LVQCDAAAFGADVSITYLSSTCLPPMARNSHHIFGYASACQAPAPLANEERKKTGRRSEYDLAQILG
jgi:hypothetical protein